jgi:hypothetical protein
MPDERIVVFLGPSLPLDAAAAVLDAEYRPPAARGDVYRATLEAPAAILLIDGVFENRPAVFHNEILWALTQGIHVFGAASIGALRAAELDRHGMVGIGAIYAAYRNGRLDRDDAVALLHGPAELGYPALTVPLVDAWATLEAAVRAGVLGGTAAAVLADTASAEFYQDRTWDLVLSRAEHAGFGDLGPFMAWLMTHAVSQKADDARALLQHVGAIRDALETPPTVSFRFEWTAAWDKLKRDIDRERHGITADRLKTLQAQLAATGELALVRSEALALVLAEMHAREEGRRFDRDEIVTAVPAFRRAHGLLRAADVERWLAENDITHADYIQRVAEHAQAADAARRHASRLDEAILRVLRRRGTGLPP